MKQYISVLVSVYKGSHVLKQALDSIYNQTYRNFEVILVDDNEPSEREEIKKTYELVKKYKTIRYIKNKKNLGCDKTFQVLLDNAKYDLVAFLAHDDILSKDALEEIINAFNEYPEAAFITRPYFWFEHDIKKPIRHVPPLNPKKNQILWMNDGELTVKGIYGSVGQISGLAVRKNLIRIPFHTDVFPGHVYPFADLLKDYPAVFLKKYTVAVGTFDSQSRNDSTLYNDSPTEQWIRMFQKIYKDKKYDSFRELCINHFATNYEGLVQIKNFGAPGLVEKEISILLKYRRQNIFAPRFWFYCIICVVTPKFILRKITDWYKSKILSTTIPKISFKT
jgi:glycosyltransferase involved in cell wall biosynthesis